jgi:ankyrin repeat protein
MENNTCPFCRTRTSNVKRIENALRNYKCNPDSPESLGKLIKKDLIELFKDPPAHPYELKFESMIDALLKFGVNLNEPLYKKSKKLISIACEEGNISRVLYLITKGGVDINMSDFHSRNYPICIAVETGNMYLFNLLVERGADLKVRNQFDQSLLSSGCCAARSAIVKRLFELTEWDVNECGRLSYTPLHHVSEKFWFGSEGTEADRVSIAEMLLAKGADINATDSDRSTPLYITASAGYLDLVELLLEHGANVNQTKRSNLTPLLAASKAGHLEIVKKLIEHGANVKARDTTRFNS